MDSDKNLCPHAGFGYMGKTDLGAHIFFLSLVCGHLYICGMFLRWLLGQKVITCLESSGPVRRFGRFSGVEDGDEGDCLFVKRGYYICQAPF